MMHRYRSDYSNQVHQLVVSMSRHYYVTKQGKYQYQKKPFEVQLGAQGTRLHAVHYVIRDHFSGLFYAEISDSDHLIPIEDFLYRAWCKKTEHPFHGIPEAISVPKTVQNVWPLVTELLMQSGIEVIDVTSGFQGGVRDIRTWEDNLRYGPYESGFPPDYTEVKSKATEICRQLATWSSNGEKKEHKWRSNLKNVLFPMSRETFLA